MPISEMTKQVVSEKRRELTARIEFLQRQKDDHQKDIANINSEISSLKSQKDALVADIPEPTAQKPMGE